MLPKFKSKMSRLMFADIRYRRISTIVGWHFVAIEFGSIQGKDESMRVSVSRCKDRSERED